MERAKIRNLKASYAPGTVRARRWNGDGDVRCYIPPRGWTAVAELLDVHPITGKRLRQSMWWIVETKR
ncbi:MAG: hypothetical protein JWR16_713 [Nevskia sp.]|nr:hypothetical protein [Nevskia sp.]